MAPARLTPFTAEHLDRMNVKANARAVAGRPEMKTALARLASMNLGFTILSSDGGTVLGVMGAVPTLPGICEVFIVASEDQAKHPISFAKCVRKELYTLKEKYRRIQAVAVNDDFHTRWLSWLGFEAEGLLRSYGLEGEDMVMWSMV